MTSFGRTLFSPSRFVRWTLTPLIVVFAVLMPLCIEGWTLTRLGLIAGLEVFCLALLAGFWLPERYGRWGFRVVAGLLFLTYAGYLVHELVKSHGRITVSHRRSGATPFNALLGFIFVGIPSLLFALKGRFGLAPEMSEAEIEAERKAYEERILKPDWQFYAEHLKRPVPPALRELYADRELVTSAGLEYDKGTIINSFGALDEEGLLDTSAQVGSEVVALATTDVGDPIYAKPGASEADTVYITHHDGGDTEVFAESVAVMVQRLRAARRVY